MNFKNKKCLQNIPLTAMLENGIKKSFKNCNLFDIPEDGQSHVSAALLLRIHSADHFRPVFKHLLSMETALNSDHFIYKSMVSI